MGKRDKRFALRILLRRAKVDSLEVVERRSSLGPMPPALAILTVPAVIDGPNVAWCLNRRHELACRPGPLRFKQRETWGRWRRYGQTSIYRRARVDEASYLDSCCLYINKSRRRSKGSRSKNGRRGPYPCSVDRHLATVRQTIIDSTTKLNHQNFFYILPFLASILLYKFSTL